MAGGQGDGQREEQDAGAHGHGACEAACVGARRDVAVAHGGHGDDRPQLLADATETPYELHGNQSKSVEINGNMPCDLPKTPVGCHGLPVMAYLD